LLWDGTADAMETELESLLAIDDVKVSGPFPTTAGDPLLGAGLKYKITFVGDLVRGDVRPLSIQDVGVNGCLDAFLTNAGNKFSNKWSAPFIATTRHASLPVYKMQTTKAIPYDASARDVKAALESLSLSCNFDVSKAVLRNGNALDITFSSYERDKLLIPMSYNGANLNAAVDAAVSVVGLQEVVISPLAKGTNYFVRTKAKNSFGLGEASPSSPASYTTSPQPPQPPSEVYAETVSRSEILVQWEPPVSNGGNAVSHYHVEYDLLPSFSSGTNGGPQGYVTVSSTEIAAVPDVQSIHMSMDSFDVPVRYIGGTFNVKFDGQVSGDLPYDVSAEGMQLAISSLCTVGDVIVTRHLRCSADAGLNQCADPQGYTWLVTFVQMPYPGDQHYRYLSTLQTGLSHKLSVDGTNLLECTSPIRGTTCGNTKEAKVVVGTVQEVQRVILLGAGDFTLSLFGKATNTISRSKFLADIEKELEMLPQVGDVTVTCASSCTNDGSLGGAQTLSVKFNSLRGDIPKMEFSLTGVASVSELRKGVAQNVVGKSSFSTLLKVAPGSQTYWV